MRKRILFIAAAITAAIMIVLSYGCAVPDENAHTDNGAYTDGYGDTAPEQSYTDDAGNGAERAEEDNSDKNNPDKDDSEAAPDKDAAQSYGTRGHSARGDIDEDGEYTSKDDVALYIHTYGRLPDNFITKDEAEDLGWHGGGLEKYAPGKSIGGDRFGNYEGSLPEKRGRTYHECDIDTRGKKSRGAKRIVFSNDGLIYYTGDHYETFELLYGEE